jgi:hypothetical protein
MPIIEPNLSKEVKAYIAKECHRILKAVEEGRAIKYVGLCSNSKRDEKLQISLKDVFHKSYPFNNGGGEYGAEAMTQSIFKNKKRMAFLRRWAKKHKN